MTKNQTSNNQPAGNAIIITTAKGMVPSMLNELEALFYTVTGTTETGASMGTQDF